MFKTLTLCPEKAYILAHFPQNYRLYEHVKTAKKGDGEPKSKTHAGGGNERQDAYLYGHPLGRKKRFRSPGDFYPHLLWLATDTEGDSDNCGCKICCPEELDASMKEKEKEQQAAAQPAIAQRPATTQPKASTTPTPASAIPSRASVPVSQPSPSPLAPAQPAARTPSKPIDYDIDSRYNLFLFRQGEMVWYDRRGAWGLGIILERSKAGPQSHYRIQPLSYPGHKTETMDITSDSDIRPWLAWTVPPFTHLVLNQSTVTPNYNTFNWEAMLAGDYGKGTVEIDASIMAARLIDASYTPFGLESRAELPHAIESRWSGTYLGAEKVWLDEPVRLVIPAGQAALRVLVVRAIVERTQKGVQGWTSSISFTGDVYVMLPIQNITMNQAPDGIVSGSDTIGVPSRMIEDIRRRNTHTIPARGLAHYWNLLQKAATYELKDIRGRWYESTLFLPIMLPGQAMEYEKKARQGDVQEVLSMMNGRGDCNTREGTRTIQDSRVQRREEALGKAVPAGTVIVEGMRQQQQQAPSQQHQQQLAPPRVNSTVQGHSASPAATTPQPQPQQQQQHQQPQQQQREQSLPIPSNPAAGFEEFMDLDGLSNADIMGNFDQSFV